MEVSPPQEHIQGSQWWTSYQPVSYRIAGRLGDSTAFRNMVDTCHAAGVKVIADAVVNHMSAGSGTGTGGTSYTKYNYPGYYQDQDFHSCRSSITDYANRDNVQNCELVGLADLNTGSEYVRSTIAAYLSNLISLGVDGFRIDAAKHIASGDLAAIKAKLSKPSVFWAQEVIYGAGEAVQPGEYTGTGDVDAFQGAYDLKRIFSNEKLAYLSNWGASWGAGYLPSGQARTFVDNWDTERNGSTLNYKVARPTRWPTSTCWRGPTARPMCTRATSSPTTTPARPTAAPSTPATAKAGSASTPGRRSRAWSDSATPSAGTAVTNWWSNGSNAIAFGRGSKGFVAINHESGSISQTFTTSLPAGTYCDVQHSGATYAVASNGTFAATIGANDAVALYAGAPCNGGGTAPASGASFSVNATTVWGQNVYVIGSDAVLGSWNTAGAALLSSAAYPVWKLDVSMSAGTSFEYKYIKKDANGNVTWESGANRTATVPASGKVSLSDTWRA